MTTVTAGDAMTMLQDLDRAAANAAKWLDRVLSTPAQPLVRKLVGWSLLVTSLTLMWNYEIESAGLFAIAGVLALMWADQGDRQMRADLHVQIQRDFAEVDPEFARRLERTLDVILRDRLAKWAEQSQRRSS